MTLEWQGAWQAVIHPPLLQCILVYHLNCLQ